VDHEVDLTREGGCQAHLEIRKEVVTAAAALNPRAKRIVEAQMGIGYEQDSDGSMMIGHVGRAPNSCLPAWRLG
jgi:hypothetical protein